ncbi:hypothetical protein CPB84DRAFT_1795375 [Gymnopilus junonius]|uniref:Uncharacterized protein n=1 Tax=Gymnopilus junonius TaxID=109634 RepID=A0A9P5NBI4_GYMJU|nr:hypothetical protein CPB84DRAFT_1795375 [Gymnopilus junonius]
MYFEPCWIFGRCLCYDVVHSKDITGSDFLPRVPRSNPLCCESILEVATPSQFQTLRLSSKDEESPDMFSAGAIGSQSSALGNAELTPDAQRLLAAIRLIVDSGFTSSNYDSSISQSLQSDHIDGQQRDGQVMHSLPACQSKRIAPHADHWHQQEFVDPKSLIIVPPASTLVGRQFGNEDNSPHKLDSFGLSNREPQHTSKNIFDHFDADVERNNDHVRNSSRSADRQVPSSDSQRSVSGTGKHAKSQEPYGHSSRAAFNASSTSATLSTPPPSTLSTSSGKRKRLDEAEHSPSESSTSAVSADCNPSPSLSLPSPSPPLKRQRFDEMTPSPPIPATPGDLPIMQGPSQGQENLGPELQIVFEDPSIVPKAKDNFRPSKYQDLI